MGSLSFPRLTGASSIAAAALLATSASAGAQTPAAPRPDVETRISLWSLNGAGGRNDLLRRARPEGDITTWMTPGDPLIARLGAEPAWSGVLVVLLTLSPEGRASACEIPTLPYDLPAEAVEGLCERLVPRVRYRPALTAAGEPVEDHARFLIRSSQYLRQDAASLPMIRAEPLPPSPPVPMPGPGWPPLVSLKPARLTGGLELVHGGGDSPDARSTPWAGIEVQLNASANVAECRSVASSGDARFDQQACAVARRADYALNGGASESERRVYLLIVRQDEALRALPQSRSGRSLPVMDPGREAALAAEWAGRPWPRVFVSVDADGVPTDCRINESAGDDALDVAACHAVRRLARFAPARDSLDRPTQGSAFVERLPGPVNE